MPDIELMLRNEQTILRNELQELKRCQIQYFLISIGSTGAIFGFHKDLLDMVEKGSMLYLTPLLIILPCWLTFFDKANTITRLTGYMRVFIEDELKKAKPSYFGYENALSEFRRVENLPKKETEANQNKTDENDAGDQYKVKEKSRQKESLLSVFYITRNQYWKISWLTFFFLSATCFLYPYFKFKHLHFLTDRFMYGAYFLSLFVEALCIFLAGRILVRLLFGKYSYEQVRDFWVIVFEELKEKSRKDA